MYMDNKGFLLMSAIFSLFLLGLVAVTCLPILSTALNNFSLADTKGNMICTAETIIEKVKSYDGDLNSEEIMNRNDEISELMAIVEDYYDIQKD